MRPDAIVIGGGLAGAAAAFSLAKGGAKTVLLERSKGPHHKVCGEFLSGEALLELRLMGLEPRTLGAVPLDRVRVAASGEAATAKLPFEALSLTRLLLDEALLSCAEKQGVFIRRGQSVLAAEPGRVTLRGGEFVEGGSVLLATGKHDLSGKKRPPGRHDGMVGIKTYLSVREEAAEAIRSSVDVAFFPGGYIGFQPVEGGGGRINACLAAERSALTRAGGDPRTLLRQIASFAPHTEHIMRGAEHLLDKPLAVGRVPYGLVRSETDGLYYIGDQAAVIPSFCGEGMGLALRSGRLAAEAILAGQPAEAFQTSFARLAGPRVKAAAGLSSLLAGPKAQRFAAGVARAAPSLVTYLAAATRTPSTDGRLTAKRA
jgi:flavin-dependent dehydrogenase